jgi:elongator complex protein 6
MSSQFVFVDGLNTRASKSTPRRSPLPPSTRDTTPQQSTRPTAQPSYVHFLDSHSPSSLQEVVTRAIGSLDPEAEILMVIDSPEIPLGTASTSASSVLSLLLKLRHLVHATVVLLPADVFPQHNRLHHLANPSHVLTPLDIEQQQLLLSLAHQADYVLATRNLDTGVAKDVSGVIRITKGGRGEENSAVAKDKEYLYLVDANRSVKVWERGTDVRS